MGFITILNGYSHTVDWIDSTECDFKVRDKIDTWLIGINSNLKLLDVFMPILNKEEIARANKYLQIKDRNRFIISRGALRIILGKYLGVKPASIQFDKGLNKKPHISDITDRNLYYNLSHSGDCILIGISNTEIGADIEYVDHSFKYQEVLADNFNADEIDYINQSSPDERFFLLWTRKEALVKATGKGLDNDLRLIPSLNGTHKIEGAEIASKENWWINSFKLNSYYTASLAVNYSREMKFWNINFDVLLKN